MEAAKSLFTKISDGRVFSRGLLTKGFEKVYAHVTGTTASLALGYTSSLRIGGRAPALLATLVMQAGALSVVSAATTSCLSAGATTADIGSSGATSVPGDATDDATWALFSWMTNIGAATALAWSMRVFALWILATLAIWARSRSRSRTNGASVSPNTRPPAVGTPSAAAATAAAPALPPVGTPPAAAAAPPAAMPAPAPGAPPAAAEPAHAHAHAHAHAPAPAAAVSTASSPVDNHVGTSGSPAPASTGEPEPVANPPAAPEPEARVGRGLRRAMQRLGRGITLASMAAKVNEAASYVDVDEVVSNVREFLSDVTDALGDVVDVAG
ncbi:unnamed protein product [Ectocarpus sp. 12 AP-2014]